LEFGGHFKRSFRWGVKNAIYETSLTDAQWAYLKPMLPQPAKRGRPPIDRRRILDAVLYIVKCGCPWRYLPTDFPHWKTVYHVFRQWTLNHQWAALNDVLRTLVRKTEGKRARPTAAVEVVKRSDATVGFKVLPHCWVVERTFGWLMRQRRLVRDYETTETSAEAWIYIAMVRIQLRRLA
jgi:transposase